MNSKKDLYEETHYRRIYSTKKSCHRCIARNYKGDYIKKTIYKVKANKTKGLKCASCKTLLQKKLSNQEKKKVRKILENITVNTSKLKEISIIEYEYENEEGKECNSRTWGNLPNLQELQEEERENIKETKIEEKEIILNLQITENEFIDEEITKMLQEATLILPTEEEIEEILQQLEKEEQEILKNSEKVKEIKQELEETVEAFTSFCKEEERLLSFEGWPGTHITPLEMASTGFYYVGEGDKVKCFYCNVVLQNWSPGDRATERHLENSSNCPMVKGEDCGNIKIEKDEGS